MAAFSLCICQVFCATFYESPTACYHCWLKEKGKKEARKALLEAAEAVLDLCRIHRQ
jgi:hypothetical protein